MKIGIIKEGKIPIDRRVPFTPEQTSEILEKFDQVSIKVQSSDIRCFKDEDYAKEGREITNDVSDCDVLFGVKEVPIENLIENKTYFFFSHTIKAQPYNRNLLRAVLDKNITLIDYETLTNPTGARVVAFGRYAGIVGAYNGLKTYGEKFDLYKLRASHECFDLEDLKTEFAKVKLPAIKIAVTGAGRVSSGALEVLDQAGIKKVSVDEYLTQTFDEPVYAQLNVNDYNKRTDGAEFNFDEFYTNPEGYESDFQRFLPQTDLLIAGAYWAPEAPVLFTREDMLEDNFNIKVIADITCDIKGSIPSTIRPSTIADPVYDFVASKDDEAPAYSDPKNVTVMAVDNLPCELPRNASNDFGRDLIDQVLPSLIGEDTDGVVLRATIAKKGALTEKYSYLQSYVDGETAEA